MGFNPGMYRYLFSDSDDGKKQPLTRALMLRVLGYARPYTFQIIWMFVAIMVSTALGLIAPWLIKRLIDTVLPSRNLNQLNIVALALILIPFASAALSIYQRWMNAVIGEGVIFDLRVALYRHMQHMSLRFFTNTRVGELMSRLNNDVVNAQNAISNTIVQILTNLITVIATLAVMLIWEWRLTLIGLLVLPFFIWFAQRTANVLRGMIRQQMEYNANMNARMNETLNISGALLVKLFGHTRSEVEQFESNAAHVRDIGIRQAVVGVQLFALLGQIGAIGTAVIFWIGGYFVIQGDITIGTIVAFGTYLTQLYGPLQALASAPVVFTTSVVSFERVFEVVDLPLDIAEKPNAIELKNVQGNLTFERVSFDYNAIHGGLLQDVERVGQGQPAAPKPQTADAEGESVHHQARTQALTDISFNIRSGELVALVGPSGAGKTSMTYLIPRLYDPIDGRILIDGIDIRDVGLSSLAANIGMVTQETYLFNDTIGNNLRYAKLDATQAELEAAAKAANIHDFIMGLENGYDSVVGERGYRLSGGEKQRIAIARVILKNPRILVLDEATSHLDSESEALIQDALSTIMQGRTSLVIAHRLSTVRAANEILVMDRGMIVERGSHETLLEKGGLYRHLYETQFGE